MPASPYPDTQSAVVSTLRAAGCVFAEDEAALLIGQAGSPAELEAMVAERASGLPLEHVLGWVEFCGLRVQVTAGVFVPRRRTELLAYEAAALARQHKAVPAVVELCCGAAAISCVLLAELERIELYAADIEPAAVRCARQNVNGRGQVLRGDLYAPLPATLRGRIDVLVANAPYVPTDSIELMPPEARLHEPSVALDGGADGLAVLRRVADQAMAWLAPGGRLLVETSEQQASQLLAYFGERGLSSRLVSAAELGATVLIGAKPG